MCFFVLVKSYYERKVWNSPNNLIYITTSGIHHLLEFQMDPVLFQTKTGWDFVYTNIFTKSVLNGKFFGVFYFFNGGKKEHSPEMGLCMCSFIEQNA